MLRLIWLSWALHASCPGELWTPSEFLAMTTRTTERTFSAKREMSEALEGAIRHFLPGVYLPRVAPARSESRLSRLVFDVKAEMGTAGADVHKLMVLRLDDLPIALVKVDRSTGIPTKPFSFSAVSTTSREAFVRLREFLFDVYGRRDPWLAEPAITAMGRWADGTIGVDDQSPSGLSPVPGSGIFRLEYADSSGDPTLLTVRKLPDSSYRIHFRRGHRGDEDALDIPADQPAAVVEQTLALIRQDLYFATKLRVLTDQGTHQPVRIEFNGGRVLTLSDAPSTLETMLAVISPGHLHANPEIAVLKIERTDDVRRVIEARLRLALGL